MTRWLDTHTLPHRPNLEFETALWHEGCLYIGGLDEAGRGAWAGPVSAAAVVLLADDHIAEALIGVDDSKRLTAEQRTKLAGIIRQSAVDYAVGFANPDEIDEIGILAATRLAMSRALNCLHKIPDHLLIDYLKLPDCEIKQTPLVKGDARCLSIACASILAKTARDSLMVQMDQEYPGYDFAIHKGYGTAKHRAALIKLGASAVHRKSFKPVSLS